jgi:hypothetical protein
MAEPISKIYPLNAAPAIQRDGTVLDTDAYTDGSWCRFYKGRPKKIGGYRKMTDQFTGLVRGANTFNRNGLTYVAAGSAGLLEQAAFDSYSGFGGGISDRSPSGFTSNASNLWQIAYQFDAGTTSTRVIAHAAPNLVNIDNSTTGNIYIGDATSTSALTAISSSAVSGGIVVAGVYLMYFGSDGFVGWSVANTPTDLTGTGSGSARVTAGKIVRGLPLRGNAGPAALFWATTGLIRGQFAGGSTVFDFDTVSSDGYSILGAQTPVEADGVYYWVGNGKFFLYNGVVRELPNTRNKRFFFDNLLPQNAQRVVGYHNPDYSEISWLFALGNSTENNWQITYNYETKEWYDTPLARTFAISAQVFKYPIMFDTTTTAGKTKAWMHEFGVDAIDGPNVSAIESYVTTPVLALPATGPGLRQLVGEDKNIQIERIEPDMVYTGKITFEVMGRTYALNDDNVFRTLSTDDFINTDNKCIPFADQTRLMRIKMTSNVQGGDYLFGSHLVTFSIGSGLAT